MNLFKMEWPRQTVSKGYVQTKQEEKYDLLMSSSVSGEQQLGKLISYIFSNEHLYINSSLRKLIEQDRKGYVFTHELLKVPLIQSYFQQIGLQDVNHKLIFLKSTITMFCSELHFNDGRVRRLHPWKRNIIKTLKPICLHDFKEQYTVSDLRDMFGEESFATSHKFSPSQEDIVKVYYYDFQHASRMLDLKNSERDLLPFKGMDYSRFCRERAREARWWQTTNIRNYRTIVDPQEEKKDRRNNRPQFNKQMRLTEADQQCKQQTVFKDSKFPTHVRNPNPHFNYLLENFIKRSPDEAQSNSSI